MRVPDFIRKRVFTALYNHHAYVRRPDQIIRRSNGDPYLLRWWLFGTSKHLDDHGEPQPRRPLGLSFYLHCFVRSDDDRALHDHPWPFTTLLLLGSYIEHVTRTFFTVDVHDETGRELHHAREPIGRSVEHHVEGDVVRRQAYNAHRVELVPKTTRGNGDEAGLRVVFMNWMRADADGISMCESGEHPCWTLFIAGRWLREWGFWCRDGWVHWRDYDKAGGCGEHGEGEEPWVDTRIDANDAQITPYEWARQNGWSALGDKYAALGEETDTPYRAARQNEKPPQMALDEQNARIMRERWRARNPDITEMWRHAESEIGR